MRRILAFFCLLVVALIAAAVRMVMRAHTSAIQDFTYGNGAFLSWNNHALLIFSMVMVFVVSFAVWMAKN